MINKRNLIFLLLFTISLTLTACFPFGYVRGSGVVVEEARDVWGFSEVELGGIGDVILEMGNEESLVIEAEDNLIQYIQTEVNGNTLKIRTRGGISLDPTEPLRYHITVVDLDSITLSGSGNIISDSIETDSFSAKINGSGNIEIEEIYSDDTRIDINGSGDINIGELTSQQLILTVDGSGSTELESGEVDSLDITINGSGKLDAGDLQCYEASVTIRGSGDITVWVVDMLDIKIAGSGDFYYYGQPRIQTTGSGSGTLTSWGLKD